MVKLSEVSGLIVFTLILIALVLPVPCLPPECGPENSEPLSLIQIVLVYLSQPMSWLIIIIWLIAIIVWFKRWHRSKKNEQ
jgi:hypothetical protein